MSQQDCLRRFLFENLNVRGEWVRLHESWQQAIQYQSGSELALQQLGEAMVAAVLLSATVKFKGNLILQAQGKGPIKTVVAQAAHDRRIRGLLRAEGEIPEGSLEDKFGEGYLAINIESGLAQPYQGIVALKGDSLAAALEAYFEQSEQLSTRIWLFANAQQAVGLLLQELPDQTKNPLEWQRIQCLASTITPGELFELSCEQILHRLFHEDDLTLFDEELVRYECQCSRLKIEKVLFSLGKVDLQALLAEQGGTVTVNCEFCGRPYQFDVIDIEKLLVDGESNSQKLH